MKSAELDGISDYKHTYLHFTIVQISKPYISKTVAFVFSLIKNPESRLFIPFTFKSSMHVDYFMFK